MIKVSRKLRVQGHYQVENLDKFLPIKLVHIIAQTMPCLISPIDFLEQFGNKGLGNAILETRPSVKRQELAHVHGFPPLALATESLAGIAYHMGRIFCCSAPLTPYTLDITLPSVCCIGTDVATSRPFDIRLFSSSSSCCCRRCHGRLKRKNLVKISKFRAWNSRDSCHHRLDSGLTRVSKS